MPKSTRKKKTVASKKPSSTQRKSPSHRVVRPPNRKLGMADDSSQDQPAKPRNPRWSYSIVASVGGTCKFQRGVTIVVPPQNGHLEEVWNFRGVLANPEVKPTKEGLRVTKFLINLTVTSSTGVTVREFSPDLQVTVENVPSGCNKLILLNLDDPDGPTNPANWSWFQGTVEGHRLIVNVPRFQGDHDPQMDV
jgi:hypothetical protein